MPKRIKCSSQNNQVQISSWIVRFNIKWLVSVHQLSRNGRLKLQNNPHNKFGGLLKSIFYYKKNWLKWFQDFEIKFQIVALAFSKFHQLFTTENLGSTYNLEEPNTIFQIVREDEMGNKSKKVGSSGFHTEMLDFPKKTSIF